MKELSFSYLSPAEITRAESMLRLGTHALKVISDHYVLTTIIGTAGKHDCPIHEILYTDIEKYGTITVKDVYQHFVDTYSQDICDLVFPKDEGFIRDKIYRTILFAMDKVYNCNEMTIKFQGNSMNSSFDQSSTPQLIYASIQEHFDIIEMQVSLIGTQITIRKKER